MTRPALLILDMINELLDPSGHYAHVCLQQANERHVLNNAATALERARAAGMPVVHVVLAFEPDYSDWPVGSPLFGEPDLQRRLARGTWGTEPHQTLRPRPGESMVTKNRVCPFHGTDLDRILRDLEVDTLYLMGVATDLVVLAGARAGHDRGYEVQVIEDATATSDAALQDAAVQVISRTATITTAARFLASDAWSRA